jgi:zinc protease
MEIIRSELFSGLPLLLSPLPGAPRMALAVAVPGGIARETVPGIAKLSQRLLLKGTDTRSAEALAAELDERAIELRELALTDCAVLLAIFLPRELSAVLTIVTDILLHSTFVEVAKEREKLLGELRASLDLPGEQAEDLMTRTLFPTHPYGFTGTRILSALATFEEPEIVRAWHQTGLVPTQMRLALVGEFDPAALIRRLDEAFAELPARTDGWAATPLAPIADDQLVLESRPDAQQAQVMQGWYAPPLGDPTHAAGAVMNAIFGGGGLSSRLFRELRDKQGLAYSVRSQFQLLKQVGKVVCAIGTSPENVVRARRGFAEQLARLQQEPVTAEELQAAIGRLAGAFVLGRETASQRCLEMVVNECYGVGAEYNTRLVQAIRAVSIADVQGAAQRLIPPTVTAIVTPTPAAVT